MSSHPDYNLTSHFSHLKQFLLLLLLLLLSFCRSLFLLFVCCVFCVLMTLHQLEIYFLIKPSQYCYFYAVTAVTCVFTAIPQTFLTPPHPSSSTEKRILLIFSTYGNKHKKRVRIFNGFH